jgi:hypothetical protein
MAKMKKTSRETGIVSLYISREKEINSEREQGKGYCV